jgi:hypothetical protein
MLDLSRIGEERRRWVPLKGSLAGIEVEIRHAGPEAQEKFRQKLVRIGVLRSKDGAIGINPGRESDWFKSYAEAYVTDWRGPIKLGEQDNPPYTAEQMARVLATHSDALEVITAALSEEADFFSQNGNGSTG